MTITTRLMGGLGNQLFQYAAGRVLAKKHKTTLRLDTSFLAQQNKNITNRPYELAPFTLKIDRLENCEPGEQDKVIEEDNLTAPEAFMASPPDSFLIGYWQGRFYIEKIKDELLETIKPTKPLSKQSQQILSQIKKTNAVLVHIRRGDYATLSSANRFHGLLPMDYYQRAINEMLRHVKDPSFFIFSDDPQWVKENLAIANHKTVYVTHNQGKNSWQDLILMSHCQHAIIANSSFSFLAAYLLQLRHAKDAKGEGKEGGKANIIAPREWFRARAVDQEKWFPAGWQLLSAQPRSPFRTFYRLLTSKIKTRIKLTIKRHKTKGITT